MKSGLLWFDDSNASLVDKIEDARKRYLKKFGICPNLVFVNARNLKEPVKIEGLTIKTKPTIMINHVWIGVTEH